MFRNVPARLYLPVLLFALSALAFGLLAFQVDVSSLTNTQLLDTGLLTAALGLFAQSLPSGQVTVLHV